MKKSLIVLLTCCLFIIGCEESNELNGGTNESSALTINGGSVGGVWSIFTEGLSEAVRREHPETIMNASPGTVAGNPVLVDEGKVEFAISESLIALFASEGKEPFDEKHENIRAVAAIIPENVFQFVAPTSAPFDSVEDIANDNTAIRYSPGEKDALGDIVSAAVFETYDMSYDDLEAEGGEVNFLSGGKTFELMRDERIDGLGKMVPIPASDIIEASATIDLKMIPIGQKAIDQLVDDYSMTPYTIPSGSYDFQTDDYDTVNTPTILITNENVSDDTVYKVTKSIYEQLEYLEGVHNGFEKVTDETITDVGGMELHPGAEKFFQENDLVD